MLVATPLVLLNRSTLAGVSASGGQRRESLSYSWLGRWRQALAAPAAASPVNSPSTSYWFAS